jgi:hypothetical protein
MKTAKNKLERLCSVVYLLVIATFKKARVGVNDQGEQQVSPGVAVMKV